MFKFKFLIIFLSCSKNGNINDKASPEEKNSINEQMAGLELNKFLFIQMANKNSGIYEYD
jgi:hypothetical protein